MEDAAASTRSCQPAPPRASPSDTASGDDFGKQPAEADRTGGGDRASHISWDGDSALAVISGTRHEGAAIAAAIALPSRYRSRTSPNRRFGGRTGGIGARASELSDAGMPTPQTTRHPRTTASGI